MKHNDQLKKSGILRFVFSVERALSNVGIGKDKEFFIENLSMLLDSGMNILSAMDSLAKEMKSKRMRDIVLGMEQDLRSGYTLQETLEHTGVFASHVVSLVRIGEESGKLVENLQVVSVEEQKEREFRSKIRSAMMYPAFVLFLTLFVGTGIAWFILPRLATVFSQLQVQLPFITRVLISLGNFLRDYGVLAVPLFVLALTLG